MLFNLVFVISTVFSCFYFFFLIIDKYFLISAVIAPNFNPISEIVISLKIRSKEAKTEMEIHPVTAKAKIRKC